MAKQPRPQSATCARWALDFTRPPDTSATSATASTNSTQEQTIAPRRRGEPRLRDRGFQAMLRHDSHPAKAVETFRTSD